MNISKLREEFATLTTAEETLLAKLETEKRDYTPEEKTASDANFARIATIKTQMDRAKTLAADAFHAKASNIELPSEPEGRAEKEAVEIKVRDRFESFANGSKITRSEFSKHVNEWLRTGNIDRRFATITGSTQSGILMPIDVIQPLAPSAPNVFRDAAAAAGVPVWKTPSTRTINLPIYTSAAGSTVSGTATSETEQEPALTESVVSVVSTYHSGNVWFENRELMAVDFDLLSESVPALYYSKELAFESAAITSVTGATLNNSNVMTSTVSGFTYANLVSLKRSLPKRYWSKQCIVLSNAAYTAAENLTTTTGFPILNQDAQNQELKRFNGTPVLMSEYLSGFGANNYVGFVFSWIGARLRDAGEGDVLQRFTQTANRQGQTGIDLYGYHSFNFSPSAVTLLQCPSS